MNAGIEVSEDLVIATFVEIILSKRSYKRA